MSKFFKHFSLGHKEYVMIHFNNMVILSTRINF
jgi:hypothetical protein